MRLRLYSIVLIIGIWSSIADSRSMVADDFSIEVKVLQKIARCGRSCAEDPLFSGFNQAHLDMLLSWFDEQTKMSNPEVCPKSETEFIPAEMLKKTETVLCSKSKKESLEMTVLFFISEKYGKVILLNFKEP
ncbi:hypothetical protein [Bdellovibrio sp. BCCA]|uniref:hypothetical protein n=1 Tax=Bdellovibrio sp. BCCA TaxID=3136281 RepID=UPI0030EFDE4D